MSCVYISLMGETLIKKILSYLILSYYSSAVAATMVSSSRAPLSYHRYNGSQQMPIKGNIQLSGPSGSTQTNDWLTATEMGWPTFGGFNNQTFLQSCHDLQLIFFR